MPKPGSLPVRPLGVALSIGIAAAAIASMSATQSWWQVPVWLVLAAATLWRPVRGLLAAAVWLGAATLSVWWAYVIAAVVSLALLFIYGPGDAARRPDAGEGESH